MDTRAFQRLRKIRQLAMAYLVYPGTLHTRFEHSVGVMHLAGLIFKRLKDLHQELDEKEGEKIRIAALLHDIGHGPFSHVSEFLLERYGKKNASAGIKDTGKIHENLTIDVIKTDPEISKILDTDETEFVVNLIKGSRTRDFKRDIISSSLDADKMDYLLRDSYFAGVKYGTYDLDKIIDSFRIYKRGEESFTAVQHEGIFALEQLVLSKHHMTQQVYAHRIRSITDAMIIRGIDLAIKAGDTELRELYSYDGSRKYVSNYLEYHDEKIVDIICSQKHSLEAQNIFIGLRDRRLFKQVCEFDLNTTDVPDALVRGDLIQLENNEALHLKIEGTIADELGISPSYVIMHRRKVKDPTYVPESYRLDEDETYVLKKDDLLERLKEFPDLVFSLKKDREPSPRILVFAKMENWSQESEGGKKTIQSEIKQVIMKTVKESSTGR